MSEPVDEHEATEQEQQQRKCCPLHPAASNREQRRAADRLCPCRGECGHHPVKPG